MIGLLVMLKNAYFYAFLGYISEYTKKAGVKQLYCHITPTIDKEPKKEFAYSQTLEIGAYSRNRTTDTGIFSPLLYQLS